MKKKKEKKGTHLFSLKKGMKKGTHLFSPRGK